MRGYTGKFLDVNLSSKEVKTFGMDEYVLKHFLGGDGLTSYYLYKEIPEGVDAMSAENVSMIATGPLTGTLWPTSGRFHIAAKSPLTGFWGEGNCGGFFGPEMKFAGFDGIVIRGKAQSPVFIDIYNDNVTIKSAEHLWGLDTYDATKLLLGDDPEAQVLVIGPSGEKGVRFSAIMSNFYRAFGRSGMGAVWGSKNLKAVRVRGTHGVGVFDRENFVRLAKEAHGKIVNDEQAMELRKYGTNLLVAAKQAIGEFPTKNHSETFFDGASKLQAEYLKEHYLGTPRACFGCSVGCKKIYKGKEVTIEGPEYEGVYALGSNLGIDDFDFILKVSDYANRTGMDHISLGVVVSFVMELFERNVISKDEMDGLDVHFGDKEHTWELIRKIGNNEGIGELLALGVKKAAEKIGRGAEKYAMHVKGQEISGQDGRGHRSVALTHAVGARGADHLRSLVTVDQLGYDEAAAKRYGRDKLPEICNPYTEKYKAYAVKVTEDVFTVRDAAIVCWYTMGWPPLFWVDDMAMILPFATGIQDFGDEKFLMEVGERIVNQKRLFNLREGLKPSDDTLPDRFTKEPLPKGPAKGQVVDLERLLNEYYQLRGWDRKTGKIEQRTLQRLHLSE